MLTFPFLTQKVQPDDKKKRKKAVGNRDADSLLQELLHHHKICSPAPLRSENNLSGPWRQADFIWLCRSTWGPRFQVCQVGLGSAVTFLNSYYKGFESGRLPSQWILGWRIREANYLDTLIYRLCFIAQPWCKISSRLHGLRAVFLMGEISFWKMDWRAGRCRRVAVS